ncbi:MAG: asparagine synthase [Xanthobacteraceae bacterium]|nr:asparagine synthase [Xanthobacteraceae bacterium]
MCGIAGLWRLGGGGAPVLDAQLRAMTDAIAYRGPDGDGHWIDAEVGVALGHRRLAIIDLTPTGVQPMASADGRIVITYNGELYNTAEIAAELAMPLRGTSDTEVLVEAIARFGIDGALARTNGLFAFAAFDRATRTLHLARDRLGIKPLYWTKQKGTLAFASELKALRTLRDLDFTLDPQSLASYLRHACVPAPRTIYRDVAKLMPGERLEVRGDSVRTHLWWDLAAMAQDAQADPDRRAEGEIVEALDALLTDAVERQMVSDVPLGAFLSGGIDSSTVVALMRKAGKGPVKTFSIGFREAAYNEADHARAVAQHLGTEHTELILSASDALAIVPQLPAIYDEPFADASQLPTFLVSRLARQHVTVALSGDGGDENFAGYVRHQSIPRMWNAMRRVPRPIRSLAGQAVDLLSPNTLDALIGLVPGRLRPRHFADKVRKGAGLLSAKDPLDMYRRLVSQWPDPRGLVREAESPGWVERLGPNGGSFRPDSQARALDMLGYLPDDILTKVDRASMAVGLEVRVPLLDHRVVQFAWRLPAERLTAGGQGKRPLRAVLDRYVPRNLIDRPKTGFGVPIGDWLRGPLRPWAEDLLSPDALAAEGLFAPDLVRARFAEHLSGRRDWQYALWPVLQFQAWRRAQA